MLFNNFLIIFFLLTFSPENADIYQRNVDQLNGNKLKLDVIICTNNFFKYNLLKMDITYLYCLKKINSYSYTFTKIVIIAAKNCFYIRQH